MLPDTVCEAGVSYLHDAARGCMATSCGPRVKHMSSRSLMGDGTHLQAATGGTLNTWRSGDDGRPVSERLQVRF
jgi:hypothetical protein